MYKRKKSFKRPIQQPVRSLRKEEPLRGILYTILALL